MSHRKPKCITPIDVHVGERIRLRRSLVGLSQMQLAEKLSLSFQQVQKYENGSNRVGAGRLHQIAEILEVPVSFFFDGTAGGGSPQARQEPLSRANLELVRCFNGITDGTVRERVLGLVRSLARPVDAAA